MPLQEKRRLLNEGAGREGCGMILGDQFANLLAEKLGLGFFRGGVAREFC